MTAAGARAGSSSQPLGNTPIGAVEARQLVSVTGIIRLARAMTIGGVPACRYVLADGTGEVDLLFLGRVSVAGFECGRRCQATGRAAERDDRIVLWNPWYTLDPGDDWPPANRGPVGSRQAPASPSNRSASLLPADSLD